MKEIKLTDTEIVLLDGRCSAATQIEVDAAKRRLALAATGVDEGVAGVIAAAVDEAKASGKLVWKHVRIGYCGLCKAGGGYAPYKAGPKRGKPNYKKPRSLSGVEMKHSFISVTFGGQSSITIGACADCVEKMLPALRKNLRGVQAELPAELREIEAPTFKRFGRRRCKACGWVGHEGQMGPVRTLFGDGNFPGVCPACAYRTVPLNSSVDFPIEPGFDVAEVSA